jgi:hypothetical protein
VVSAAEGEEEPCTATRAGHRYSARSRAFMTSAIGNRTDQPGVTAGIILYLTTAGLLGAAIIICFGVASFSFLYNDKEMLEGSGLGNRDVEVRPMRSDAFLYNAAPVAVETSSTMPPIPIPAQQRDQMFQEFESYHTKFDGDNQGPRENTPAENLRKSRKHD